MGPGLRSSELRAGTPSPKPWGPKPSGAGRAHEARRKVLVRDGLPVPLLVQSSEAEPIRRQQEVVVPRQVLLRP